MTIHLRVLSVLEKQSLQYHIKEHETTDKDAALYNEALNKTRTVNTECLTDSDNNLVGTDENTTVQ